MQSMLVNHGITLTMNRKSSIRRYVNDMEDIVKAYSIGGYSQPQIIPLPDDLDPEIPRMMFTAREGHSQVLVSQLAVAFNVNYSPDWASQPQRCLEYLQSKIEMLFKIAHAGWDEAQPRFSGVVTTFQFDVDHASDAIGIVAPSFTESQRLLKEAGELSYRWSLGIGDEIYQNIAVSTLMRLKSSIKGSVDTIPKFNPRTVEGYGVEVKADLNDRLAYNFRDDYESSEGAVRKLAVKGFETTSDVVSLLLKRVIS